MGIAGDFIYSAAVAYGVASVAGAAGKGPLAKGPPPAPKVAVMPDQTSIDQASQLQEAQAAALRQGRASTVLTNNSNTSDKLGP